MRGGGKNFDTEVFLERKLRVHFHELATAARRQQHASVVARDPHGNLVDGHNQEKPPTLIEAIDEDISEAREKLFKRIRSHYGDSEDWKEKFMDLHDRSASLNDHIQQLQTKLCDEMATIQTRILPNLGKVAKTYEALREEELEEQLMADLVQQLDDMDTVLKKIEPECAKNNFQDAARLLDLISMTRTQMVNYIAEEEFATKIRSEIESMLDALKVDMIVIKENLIDKMTSIWHDNFQWLVESENTDILKLKIRWTVSMTPKDLDNLVATLTQLKEAKHLSESFADQFMRDIITPIVNKPCSVGLQGDDTIILRSCSESGDKATSTDAINRNPFREINTLFGHLCTLLHGPSTRSLVRLIGAQICAGLFDTVACKYLQDRLPSEQKQFKGFIELVDEANTLKSNMIKWGYVKEEDDALRPFNHFVSNMNSFLAASVSQGYVLRARDLINKEMHHTRDLYDEWVPKCEGLHDLPELKGLFMFPSCKVSESTFEFQQLIKEILEEAASSSPLCASALCSAARNAFSLYIDLMPVKHNKMIMEIPAQSAIFLNNCMYMAHLCLTLGAAYQRRLPSEVFVTFLDLVPILRQLGNETFLSQMRRQRQMILGNLQETVVLEALVNNEDKAYKDQVPFRRAVNKSLMQLTRLKESWFEVLPRSVYNTSIAALCTSLMDEIIQRISTVEDISSDAAVSFVAVIDHLMHELPKLFREAELGEVMRLVSSWVKFGEFKLLLKANLQEIVDRWCGGAGPLAMVFSAEHVKHLVRALFQNTDRRARALAMIR